MRKDTCKEHISLRFKCKWQPFSDWKTSADEVIILFLTLGGLKGYSAGKTMSIKKAPWKRPISYNLRVTKLGVVDFWDHDLVVWSRIGNQQALPHQQVGLVHLHKVRLEAKANSKDYLDVSEGFASRLPQVSKLLLQSPGGRHSPLQQCPTL